MIAYSLNLWGKGHRMSVHGAIFMAGVLLGLAMMAWTASARGPSAGVEAASVLAGWAGGGDSHSHSHEMADIAAHAGKLLHNPDDHTHPFGQDNYHQKVSHASLDFAFGTGAAPPAWATAPPFQIVVVNVYARGITHSPPVPPPL